MKEWFKYEFGYVNIDSENLYLTNSGNWSETKGLSEKTKKVAAKSDNKSSSIIGFILAVAGLFGFLIYKSLLSGKAGLSLILITVVGGYKLYDYLKSEIGAKFKIPLEKISEIKDHESGIEIFFTNGEGKPDSYKLQKVAEKGFAVMHSLKAQLAC